MEIESESEAARSCLESFEKKLLISIPYKSVLYFPVSKEVERGGYNENSFN